LIGFFRRKRLLEENAALKKRLSELPAAIPRLQAENEALKAQLHNVGLEFIDARKRLEAIEAAKLANLSDAAREYLSRNSLILLPRLLALLPEDERLVIVDGGAREVEKDPRWLAFPPNRLRFFGFEADPTEAARLNQAALAEGTERTFYPAGLWGKTGSASFEHNRASGGSSFLRIKRSVTDRWKFENPTQAVPSPEMFYPVRYEELPVVSIADWAQESGVATIDFLKLNVQGGELEVLRGAGSILDAVLGILIEVAFVESYCDRPMFSDIDVYLRNRGFAFFDLLTHHYVGRAASPIAAQHLTIVDPGLSKLVSAWGQLIEGHALYLRDPVPTETSQLNSMRVIKLAAIAEAYGQIEFAFELLDWLHRRPDIQGTSLAAALGKTMSDASAVYAAMLRPGL
jgi:FkbM family methyltransferase